MPRLRFLLDRLLRRHALDREMDEEIRSHLAERAAHLQSEGVPPAEAARRARLEFGGVENYKEQCRDSRHFHLLHAFFQDLRFAGRMFRRTPGVFLLALLCLTVGIGANAAVWSWIEGILLRPFPAVAHQERMMALAGTYRGAAGGVGNSIGISWPDFLELRKGCTLFDAFIADRIVGTNLGIGNRAQRATGSVVSANYFDALGVHPILGRGFEPGEEAGRNAHPVTVISFQLWKQRFHSDPAIIGRSQLLNGVRHTIVGVAPPGFFGTFVGWPIQFWVPAAMQETFDPPYKLEDRRARWIEGFVLLKPGITPQQAQAEISAVAGRLQQAYPLENRARGVKLFPLWRTPFNAAGLLLPTLGIALAVVVFVLLIACANVSNLLLARGLARRHEMTVRLAVGAKRLRLLRQLLTESLLLASLALAGGLLFAYGCRNLLVSLLPARGSLTMNLPGHIDWRVLALSAALCLLSTALFGVVPAVQASQVDLSVALKEESGSVVGGGRRTFLRSALVLVQLALSFVLLVGTALLLRSLLSMQSMSPGFSERVLTTYVDMAAAGYDEPRSKSFEDQLVDRLLSVPGVRSAAFARIMPFGYRGYSSAPIAVEGYTPPSDEPPTLSYNEVGPGYLAVMGIPLRSGREFTRTDNETARPVAIVNQSMAAQYWPGRDAVGSRLQVKGRWLTVVGVAQDSKYRSLTEPPAPFFYVPIRQSVSGQVLHISTSLPPRDMALTLAHQIHSLDENLALGEVATMGEEVARTMAPQRIALMMLGLFGLLALLLAGIGLYGIMSYKVSQSTRELGLRMALGASPADLLRLVVAHGLGLTALGMVVGVVVALASSRLLGYLLYRVSPRDPLAFASALTVMLAAALAACFVPAWRAARIDPARALRH